MKRAFLHLYKKAHKSHPEVLLFGTGLRQHGWQVEAGDTEDYPASGADLVVQWGARVEGPAMHTLEFGGEVCTLETAYIEPRADYCSIGFGVGVNNRLRHYGPLDSPVRWERFFKDRMKPWRRQLPPAEQNTLIMGQCPGDMALKGHEPFFHWVLDTYRTLKEADRSPLFRAHPNMSAQGLLDRVPRMRKEWKTRVHRDEQEIWLPWCTAYDEGIPVMPDGVPLADALNRARSVVTFNSNSGVDAVLSGVPTVAMDEGSMAWEVTGRQPCDIVQPDRTAWAHALAWKQWTRDELASGNAWDTVCPPHLR